MVGIISKRRLPAAMPRLVSSTPHLTQLDQWDCGLACLAMVLAAAYSSGLIADDPSITHPYNLRQFLDASGSADSVWTIDLAYMMRHFGIDDFTYYTSYIGVNIHHSAKHFYKDTISVDRRRIHTLFAEAQDSGVRVVPMVLSMDDIRRFLLSERYAIIILVNLTKLKCRICSRSSAVPAFLKYRKKAGTANGCGSLFWSWPSFKQRQPTVATTTSRRIDRGEVQVNGSGTQPSWFGHGNGLFGGAFESNRQRDDSGVFDQCCCFPSQKSDTLVEGHDERVETTQVVAEPRISSSTRVRSEFFESADNLESMRVRSVAFSNGGAPAGVGRVGRHNSHSNPVDERTPLLQTTAPDVVVSGVQEDVTVSGMISSFLMWLGGGGDPTFLQSSASLPPVSEDRESTVEDMITNKTLRVAEAYNDGTSSFSSHSPRNASQRGSSPQLLNLPMTGPASSPWVRRLSNVSEGGMPLPGSPPGVGIRQVLISTPASVKHLPPPNRPVIPSSSIQKSVTLVGAPLDTTAESGIQNTVFTGDAPSKRILPPVVEAVAAAAAIPAAIVSLLGSPPRMHKDSKGSNRPPPLSLDATRSSSMSSTTSSAVSSVTSSPRASTALPPMMGQSVATPVSSPVHASPFRQPRGRLPSSSSISSTSSTQSSVKPSADGNNPVVVPGPSHNVTPQSSQPNFNVNTPSTSGPTMPPAPVPTSTSNLPWPSSLSTLSPFGVAMSLTKSAPSIATPTTPILTLAPPHQRGQEAGSPRRASAFSTPVGSTYPSLSRSRLPPAITTTSPPSQDTSLPNLANMDETKRRVSSTSTSTSSSSWAFPSSLFQPLQLASAFIASSVAPSPLASSVQNLDSSDDGEGSDPEGPGIESPTSTTFPDDAPPLPAPPPSPRKASIATPSEFVNSVFNVLWASTRTPPSPLTLSPATAVSAIVPNTPVSSPNDGGGKVPQPHPWSPSSSSSSSPSGTTPPDIKRTASATEPRGPQISTAHVNLLSGAAEARLFGRRTSLPEDAPITAINSIAARRASASPVFGMPHASLTRNTGTNLHHHHPLRASSPSLLSPATSLERTGPPATDVIVTGRASEPVRRSSTFPGVTPSPTVSAPVSMAPPLRPVISPQSSSSLIGQKKDEFMGHYVVLVGYDPETDGFLVRDPGTEEELCFVDAEVLDGARSFHGTDHDAIVVRVR